MCESESKHIIILICRKIGIFLFFQEHCFYQLGDKPLRVNNTNLKSSRRPALKAFFVSYFSFLLVNNLLRTPCFSILFLSSILLVMLISSSSKFRIFTEHSLANSDQFIPLLHCSINLLDMYLILIVSIEEDTKPVDA